jgi:hypothetical protein
LKKKKKIELGQFSEPALKIVTDDSPKKVRTTTQHCFVPCQPRKIIFGSLWCVKLPKKKAPYCSGAPLVHEKWLLELF